ncbi:MAG: bifunctional oligoribonuclease/PAP phosphatase NrnA [Clostridia bacterium]|nr:bifunctional oligoribonuclease/PAP phosphatase NrnA [Clostridia bacterium]
MVNNSLKEITQELLKAKTMLLYPHVNPDGDALGSCIALERALRQLGKEAYVLVEGKLPNNLQFLDDGYITEDQNILENPDISIAVDCSQDSRIKGRLDKFKEAKNSICIDHHENDIPLCQYNYIDSSEAACSQIMYKLLLEMQNQSDLEFDKEMCNALYTGILTDTGCFKNSNSSFDSFNISAELVKLGANTYEVAQEVYEKEPIGKIELEAKILETLKSVKDGKILIAYASQKMLEETNTEMDMADSVVTTLRSIEGTEVSVLLKEYGPEEIKVSMRSKSYVDLVPFAKAHGGGGHTRASGYTIEKSLKDAILEIEREIVELV